MKESKEQVRFGFWRAPGSVDGSFLRTDLLPERVVPIVIGELVEERCGDAYLLMLSIERQGKQTETALLYRSNRSREKVVIHGRPEFLPALLEHLAPQYPAARSLFARAQDEIMAAKYR